MLFQVVKKNEIANMAIPPRSYQKKNVDVCIEKKSILISDEIGLGKTCTAITLICRPECRPSLIVIPSHLQIQWAHELHKFCPSLIFHIINKRNPYPLPYFLGNEADVIIVSYSKIYYWASFLKNKFKSVVFDECHELRRTDSKKYIGAREISITADYRMGLSATPLFNYGGEIFNVINVLSPGRLGTSYEFHNQWCFPGRRKGLYFLKEPRIFAKWIFDNKIMVRNTREDVGDKLPDIISMTQKLNVKFKINPEEKKELSKLARYISSKNKKKSHIDYQKFSNMMRKVSGLSKAKEVAKFVRNIVEAGEKVVLAGWHRSVYGIWDNELNDLGICYYTGKESGDKKNKSKNDFISGDANILVISLRSGIGLDGIQSICRTIVFGELDWSPSVHLQVIGRLHRNGQRGNVLAYYLISEHGADPMILNILEKKKNQASGFFESDDLGESKMMSNKIIEDMAKHFIDNI
jgi:SNF2 family DNA or RNA helicase